MILDHVADGARLVVEGAAALDPKIFGQGDLHALDVVSVPEGLQEGVREPEEQHVVHRPLAEVMVDAKDPSLVEARQQRTVERLRRNEVATERLFDDDATAIGPARSGQLFHDEPEQCGWDGEVVRRALGGAELPANGLERRRISVIAVDVAQHSAQRVERHGVKPAVLLHAVARAGTELVDGPPGLRHADDRHVEMAALRHRLQRREDLLVREIARRAEEHERIGDAVAHRAFLSVR